MTTSTTPSTCERVTFDRLVRALSCSRRRTVLRILRDRRSVQFPELVDEVARREYGRPIDELSADEIDAVRIELYHHHVPLLVERGLVVRTAGRQSEALSAAADLEELLSAVLSYRAELSADACR